MWEDRLKRELDELRAKNRYRSLQTYGGIDFGSNDYLGFAVDKELKEEAIRNFERIALSSSGSRLLPGNHSEHLEAEKIFAKFVGSESALLFNSGYDANHALLTTLPTRHDLILYDERSHASIYDGVHVSLAKSRRFHHNSAEDLTRIIPKDHSGQIFIVLESVYSMDGDVARLQEIAVVAKEASAVMIVDEAHATGVLGTKGEGLVSSTIEMDERIITVHTCGKSLGAAGAFVCSSNIVKEYLINKARGFIFTTALPPIMPLQTIAAVKQLQSNGTKLVLQLKERSDFVRMELKSKLTKWDVRDDITPIISIIIGSDSDTLKASSKLKSCGFEVPAVRPPTVPEGTARLRLNVSLRHSEDALRQVVDAICNAERELT